ncbi:MAG: MobA/MobL family protein [Magnetospirillum sp.]|nr:MobA/MobL family protein [Magnetospirillum sp.]
MDHFDEDFWKKHRPGRLDEGDQEVKLLLGGRHGVPPPVLLRMARRFAIRHQQPIAQVSQDVRAKYAAVDSAPPGTNIQPVHFRQSRVSAPRTWSLPNSVKERSSVAIFPIGRDVEIVKEAGAKYCDRHHVWTIASNSKFLTTPKGRSLSTPAAAMARERWRNGSGAAKSKYTAVDHQVYIERHTRNGERRQREIIHDSMGPILLGSIGATLEQRKLFWRKIADSEARIDATLQLRIIAELPYDLPPERIRNLLTEFGEVFDSKQLGWFAAVHQPNTAAGGDKRNIHVHIVYFDRPIIGWKPQGSAPDSTLEPDFAERKNRDCAGAQWIRSLREAYVNAVNRALVEHYAKHPQEFQRLYHPGSYSDIGILQKCRQRHLGQTATALERRGIPSKTGLYNIRSTLTEIEARESRCLDRLTELYAKLNRVSKKLQVASTARHATPIEIQRLSELLASQSAAIENLLVDIDKKAGSVILASYAEIDPLHYAGTQELLSRALQGDGLNAEKTPPPTYAELLIRYLDSLGHHSAARTLIDELVKLEKVENIDEIIRQRRILTSLRLPVLRALESSIDELESLLSDLLKTNQDLRKALERDTARSNRQQDLYPTISTSRDRVRAIDAPANNTNGINNAKDAPESDTIASGLARESAKLQSEDISKSNVASAIQRLLNSNSGYTRAKISEKDLKRFSVIELKQLYNNRARALEASERPAEHESLRYELHLIRREIDQKDLSRAILKDPEVINPKDTDVQQEPLRKPKRDTWDR